MADDEVDVCEKWKPGKSIAFRCSSKVGRNQDSQPLLEKGNKYSRYFKRRKDELSRHLRLIRNGALDRCIQERDVATKPKYGYTIGKGRLTRRIGFSALAKHSEMVFNPKCLPPALRETVREDIKALVAKDPDDDAVEWTKAPPFFGKKRFSADRNTLFQSYLPILSKDRVIEDTNNVRELLTNSADISDSKVRASLISSGVLTQSQKHFNKQSGKEPDKKALFFPPDPPLFEIAERITSSLPFLSLRNGDSTTYSRAACTLVGNALKAHGIQLSHDGTAVITREEENNLEEQTCEDILKSFYNQTGPFDASVSDLTPLVREQDDLDVNEMPALLEKLAPSFVGTKGECINVAVNRDELSQESFHFQNPSGLLSFHDKNFRLGLQEEKNNQDIVNDASHEGLGTTSHLVNNGQNVFDRPFTDFSSDGSLKTKCDLADILNDFHGFDYNKESDIKLGDNASSDAGEITSPLSTCDQDMIAKLFHSVSDDLADVTNIPAAQQLNSFHFSFL